MYKYVLPLNISKRKYQRSRTPENVIQKRDTMAAMGVNARLQFRQQLSIETE